jgi:hypothetical protein
MPTPSVVTRLGRRSLHLSAWVLFLALLCGLLLPHAASAVPVSDGYRDFSFGSAIPSPTTEKPQSKLWWNDGIWWGVLYSPSAAAYCIHRLDLSSQSWSSTGVVVDTRAGTAADTLWDGTELYIVSGNGSLAALLMRYSYDSSSQTYTLDSGFPVTVRTGGAETITLAKDSTGQLWATYESSSRVLVNRSLGSDSEWGKPFVLSLAGATPGSDDIAAVVAFGGDRIGIMWSNQNDRKFYFAVHRDEDPDTTWQPSEIALGAVDPVDTTPWADDHISLATDSDGRVFAAVKTSLNDVSGVSPEAPLGMLLVRDPSGTWTSHTFGQVRDKHTRPIVVLDEEHERVYVLATAPEGGGGIYYKTAPVSDIRFATGRGVPFIRSATDIRANDVTSTKQRVNATTGLLALASDSTADTYLHNYLVPAGEFPVVLHPIADTYVRDGSYSGTNYGTSRTLAVRTSKTAGYTHDAHLKFDLTGIHDAVSAKLRVYAAVSTQSTLETTAWAVPDVSWSETGLTWNNRPALGAPLSSVTVAGTTAAWYELDVTSHVQAELSAGRSVVGVALHNVPFSSPYVFFPTKEGSFTSWPELVITRSANPPATDPPATPTGLVATATSSSRIHLAWTDNASDETGFTIEESADGVSFTFLTTLGADAATYSVTGLPASALRYYRVQAFNAAGSSAWSNVAEAVTFPSQDPVTLPCVADTYVQDGSSADTNFGSATTLLVKSSTATGVNRDTYLKFDLSSVPSVGGARLRIYSALTADGTVQPSIYAVADTTWSESTVTWNNRPPLGATIASVAVSGTSFAWYEIDVTAYLQAEKAAGRNLVTIALHVPSTASSAVVRLYSRERPANRPELVVTP